MRFAYLIEPPFNYRSTAGAVLGCDVELARHVAEQIGAEAFDPVEAEFAELLPGLAAGRWRMTTGLFATPERQKTAAFSRPIWALPDGLLVARGNPFGLTGYTSVARARGCRLAVIRDQIQHRTAEGLAVPVARILIFDTYAQAARAVTEGHADAYASVARAHGAFLAQNPGLMLDCVTVPAQEKPPAFGAFAFARGDDDFRAAVDAVLLAFLGSAPHRRMMARHGFAAAEIDLLL